jgi:DNA invertase Pin-like site-specific DNA recombinase
MGEHLFYIRISDAKSQNTARQEEVFEKGFFDAATNTVRTYDKKFVDKASGRSKERPGLQKMLDYSREGDHIYVSELSRLGRNMKELLQIVEDLRSNNIAITFLKENLTIKEESDATSNFIFAMFVAMSQFEVDLAAERREAGRKVAIDEGRIIIKVQPEDRPAILEAKEAGETARSIAERYNVSHTQILRICKEEREKQMERNNAPDMM